MNTDNPQNKSDPTGAAKHFMYSRRHTAKDMQLIPIEKSLFWARPRGKGDLF